MDTEQQTLKRRPSVIPPVAVQPGVEKLDSPTSISHDTVFPAPTFAKATEDGKKGQLPQCIAHRGYKAKFPENSILAFEEAVKAGAQAIETDVHYTKDDVVVISHDNTLKRCFGRPDKLLDLNWDEVKEVRSTAAPHVPVPRLEDLLEFLARPGMEDIWVLLDIKLDNEAEDIMRLIGATFSRAKQPTGKPWNQRIVLGLWAAKFLPLASKYLPGFPVMHIGFKVPYAKHFLNVPNVGFNMLFPSLIAPGGRSLMRQCEDHDHRQFLAWTVNETDKMEWCIRRQVDGVITDDPSHFVRIREDFDGRSQEPFMSLNLKTYIEAVRMYLTILFLFFMFRKKLGPNHIQKVKK